MYVSNMKKAMAITQDLGSAWLFERIAFWLQHATIERNGIKWIAKNYDGWMEETNLSYKQVRTSLEKLRKQELIQTCRVMWKNVLYLHVTLTPRGHRLLKEAKGPNGPHHTAQAGGTVTPKWAVTYKEQGGLQGEQHGVPCGQEPANNTSVVLEGDEQNKEENTMTLKTVQEVANSKPKQYLHKPDSVYGMQMVWKKHYSETYSEPAKAFIKKEAAQLKMFIAKCPEGQAPKVIEWMFGNWTPFSNRVEQDYGIKTTPYRPVVGFALQYLQTAVNMMKPPKVYVTKELPEPVKSFAPKQTLVDTPKYKPATPEEVYAILTADDEQDADT